MHSTGHLLLQAEQLVALATAIQEGLVPGLNKLTTSAEAHSQLQMRQHALPSVSHATRGVWEEALCSIRAVASVWLRRLPLESHERAGTVDAF